MTHKCVSKLTIIGSDNGLWPGRRQAIICTNAGILLFSLIETNFSEILLKIHTFSFKKMHLKMSSATWRPFVSASMALVLSAILLNEDMDDQSHHTENHESNNQSMAYSQFIYVSKRGSSNIERVPPPWWEQWYYYVSYLKLPHKWILRCKVHCIWYWCSLNLIHLML